MDGDFSVRNEVDSLRPPQSDTFSYDHEPSPYDDILDGINSAPPFPSAPINYPPYNPQINHQQQMYDSILRQQMLLIRQQQLANDRLMKIITEKKDNSINWKYITFGLAAFGLYLMTRTRGSRRLNPRRERLLHHLDELSDY